MVATDARRGGEPLRRKFESAAIWRRAQLSERCRLRGTRSLHGLADRPERQDRKAQLVRPGDAARCPRLRFRPTADPRAASRHAARDRRWQGRTCDRVESTHAPACVDDSGRRPPQRPGTAAATPCPRLSGAARRSPDTDGLLRWTRLRPGGRPLHARQRHRLPPQLPQHRLRPREGRVHGARRGHWPSSVDAPTAFARLRLCHGRPERGVHRDLRRGGVRVRRRQREAAVVGSRAGWNKCLPHRRRRSPAHWRRRAARP